MARVNVPIGRVIVPEIDELSHEGHIFYADLYEAALGAGAFLDLLLTTAANTNTHCWWAISADSEVHVHGYEDTTSVIGSPEQPITLFNRNRASNRTLDTLLSLAPALSSPLGTRFIGPQLLPGGTGQQSIGAQGQINLEYMLRPASKYLFRVENTSASASQIAVGFIINEEPI